MFRAVGLRGEGGIGDLKGLNGDFSDSDGRDPEEAAAVVEMFKDNLGFAEREASMLMMSKLKKALWFDIVFESCLEACG